MDELQGLESQKSGLISSLSGKEKEIEDKIGDLVSYNRELQQALDDIFNQINNGNNGGNNSGGNNSGGENSGGGNSGGDITPGDPNSESFLRPGNGIVTDPYGPRINPVTGESGF
ncbi:hypothetical protein GNF66_15460, partial [Clostridium perfringens]|nr:hypothetical protein [Clostridium perfringens]